MITYKQKRTLCLGWIFSGSSLLLIGCGGGNSGSQVPTSTPSSTSTPSPSQTPSNAVRPTEAEIRTLPPVTLEQIVQIADLIAREHPKLDQNSGEFSRLVFDRTKTSAKSTQRTLSSYEILGTPLTNAELALIFVGLNFKYAAITKVAAQEAIQAAGSTFPEAIVTFPYLTKFDAFRHAYWNALMVKRCDSLWASAYATAHESEPEAGREDDTVMDLSNNAVGRRIARENSKATDAQLQSIIKSQRYEQMQSNVTSNESRLVYMRAYKIAQIDVTPANNTVDVGKSITLTAAPKSAEGRFVNIMPGEAKLRTRLIDWKSSDASIASVSTTSGDQPGDIKATIQGIKAGIAQITITITEGGASVSKSVPVKVGAGLLDGTWSGVVSLPDSGDCKGSTATAVYTFTDNNGPSGGPVTGSVSYPGYSSTDTGTRTGNRFSFIFGDGTVNGDTASMTAHFYCAASGRQFDFTFPITRNKTKNLKSKGSTSSEDCGVSCWTMIPKR